MIAITSVLILAFSLSVASSGALTSAAHADSRPTDLQPTERRERPTAQTSGVTPSSGPPGTRITVRGSGFRSFDTVESISMGGLEVLGNRTVTVDGNGQFTVSDLVVPGLDPGIVSLTIKVGTGDLETTAVGAFEVTAAPGPAGNALPVAEALSPLGDALERVFYFENTTKTWIFFDPRPAFLEANTLHEIIDGQVYWVKVTRSTTATLNGTSRELTCANEGTPQQNCWNLVVW